MSNTTFHSLWMATAWGSSSTQVQERELKMLRSATVGDDETQLRNAIQEERGSIVMYMAAHSRH